MEALGRHIIAELSYCSPEVISNIDKVQDIMVKAAKVANAEVREVVFHKFNPQGVSGVVVIAESHLSIHTWPEYGYAAIDIYTCGSNTDPERACDFIAGYFGAGKVVTTKMDRGIPEKGTYSHIVSSCFHEGGCRIAQNT